MADAGMVGRGDRKGFRYPGLVLLPKLGSVLWVLILSLLFKLHTYILEYLFNLTIFIKYIQKCTMGVLHENGTRHTPEQVANCKHRLGSLLPGAL